MKNPFDTFANLLSMPVIFAVMTVVAAGSFVLAAPPGSPYDLGETLDPTCAPGDANCSVVTPAASGDNADIDSLTGPMGIGTIGPSQQLDVEVTSSSVPILELTNTVSSTTTWNMGIGTPSAGANGAFILSDSSVVSDFIFYPDGTLSVDGAYINRAGSLDILTVQDVSGVGNLGIIAGKGSSSGGIRWTSGEGSLFRIGRGLTNSGVFNPASGDAKMQFLDIDGEINQLGTASGDYTALNINIDETNFLGTDGRLIDAKRNGISQFIVTNDGQIGLGVTSISNPIEHSSGAVLTAGGTWSDASSRELKEHIEQLSREEALAILQELDPVHFNYKAMPEDPRLGFIAEDVPDAVASPERKNLSSMDIVAVLTKVIQAQEARIQALEASLK